MTEQNSNPNPLNLPDQQLLEFCAKEAIHKTKKRKVLSKTLNLKDLFSKTN